MKLFKLGVYLSTSIITGITCLGVFWLLLFLFSPKKNRNCLLACVIILSYFVQLIIRLSAISTNPDGDLWNILLPIAFNLLFFMSIWFYALKLSGRWDFQIYKWHLVPGITEFLVLVAVFFLSIKTSELWSVSEAVVPFLKLCLVLHITSSIVYGFKALWVLVIHERSTDNSFAHMDLGLRLDILVLGFILVILLNDIVAIFGNQLAEVITSELFILINVLYFSSVLFIVVKKNYPIIVSKILITSEEKTAVEIPAEFLETLADYELLLAYIEKEKPFLRKDLVLSDLATDLQISDRYLRQLIQTHTGMHFNHFINKFRVNLTKKLLLSNQYEHYTLLAIGQEAGFQAKTTFFTAFKYFEKMTPATFQRLEKKEET